MNRFLLLTALLLFRLGSFCQLKDIKIIIPKEVGFSYSYNFADFFQNDRYVVVCGNALTVLNTETSEVIDEADLPFGLKNMSVSPDGNFILCTVNSELFIYSFKDQKLELVQKSNTAELVKGLPNGQWYGSIPIGGCFFTNKPGEIYASMGCFTVLYDVNKKEVTSSHTFSNTVYVINAVYYSKKNEALLARADGTNSILFKQSLSDLTKVSDVVTDRGIITKLKVRDSLVLVNSSNKHFIFNLESGKVVHEVRMALVSNNMYYTYDKKMLADLNKRPANSKPDTLNFSAYETVFDFDYSKGNAYYSTTKGLKVIDLKTKKLKSRHDGGFYSMRISRSGQRMVTNIYANYRSLRIYDPTDMKMISEHPALGNAITSANVSPNRRWLFTNGSSSGYFWDLRNFSKYAEVKDISGSDSSYVYAVFFLNDSEVVVNSGSGGKKMNLSIYNIHRKQYSRTIKKGVFAFASGFMNGEFYYADHESLHIMNLKTLAEEKYEGLYSMAATDMYRVVNYTKDLVFVPEAGKFKIVNRKTKKTEYESAAWGVTTAVTISDDGKFVYTTGQITKKKKINGYEVEVPTSAVLKIDLSTKQIVRDYANTYYHYDFKIKDNGKTVGVWYVKQDYDNPSYDDREAVYSEYNAESGEELFTRSLGVTKEIMTYHNTSETGKYFVMSNPNNTYFKVFDAKGYEVIDLSDTRLQIPKCFFDEQSDRLILTSQLNSLVTFVDLKNKRLIGQLANAYSDNFFLVTSDLHYLGSKEFVKHIRFKYKSEVFSFEQFDAYLNQPHKVLRAFNCSDSALIQAYETAYLKRMKVLGLKPDSKLNFATLPGIQSVVMKDGKPGFVTFHLSANKGQNKLTKLEVYNNGTLIFSEPIDASQSSKYDKSMNFETSSGINRFEFVVHDDQGLQSPHISRLYNNTNLVKPNLFLVVIASEKFKSKEYDLAYAVKDASDMANTMANSKTFNKVEVKKLFNQSFSPDSVNALKNFFGKASVNDVVMVFFAGHGYLDTDLSYYFPTYYTDFTDPKINSVAYSSFEKLFKEMKPIRKLMFIDACFSGEVDADDIYFEKEEDRKKDKKDSTRAVSARTFAQSTALEMSKAIFSDIRQNSGATIISSAGGTEAALEGETWNNGLFTHCLLEGMKNLKADTNTDKKISLSELQKFVAEEVFRLSGGSQTPTYRMENTVLDYELW